MGLFDLLEDVVRLPVDIVKDVVSIPSRLAGEDDERSAALLRLKKILAEELEDDE